MINNNKLSLIPIEELLAEVQGRFSNSVFIGSIDGMADGNKCPVGRCWSGDPVKCIGLLTTMQHIIIADEHKKNQPR